MSRKSNSKNGQQSLPRIYVFAVADSHGSKRVVVAAPVFYQLIRRGWAVHSRTDSRRDQSGRPIEERVAVLVSRLSFRSLKPSPEGNLCFKSLLESTGVSIKSNWELMVERAWALDPRSHCPQTWEEKIALQNERQVAIWEECKTWGIPEPQPIQTGLYGSPEQAALAIAERAMQHNDRR